MKYIKEYYNQTSYEEISKFDYGNTPVFNELRTFTNTDAIKLDNILKRLKLKYKSKVELSNFWFLNWPIWLKSEYIDTSDINQVEWLNEWSEIFKSNIRNNESDKNPIYKDKQLYLRCQTEDKYFYQAGYRMFIVNIICDTNDYYYYIEISLEGYKKYFKCDQEHGLENCLETELKKWKFP